MNYTNIRPHHLLLGLIAVPAVAFAAWVAWLIVPEVLRVVVPEVVRTVGSIVN